MQEAKKLETDFDKIPELQQLREVRRLNGEERKKLQLTRMSCVPSAAAASLPPLAVVRAADARSLLLCLPL